MTTKQSKNNLAPLALIAILAFVGAYFSGLLPFAVVPDVEYEQVASVSDCGQWSVKYVRSYVGSSGTRHYVYDYFYAGTKVTTDYCDTRLDRRTFTVSHVDPIDGRRYYLKTVMYSAGKLTPYCYRECLPASASFTAPNISEYGRASVVLALDPGFEQQIDLTGTRIVCSDGVSWGDASNQIDPTMLGGQNITVRWILKEDMPGLCKVIVKNDCGYTGDWNSSHAVQFVVATPKLTPTPSPTATPELTPTPEVTPSPTPTQTPEDEMPSIPDDTVPTAYIAAGGIGVLGLLWLIVRSRGV